MRNEALFSRSGFYGFLLTSNVLLHRETTVDSVAALKQAFPEWPADKPLRVLDLACGGWPQAIADVMAALPDIRFEYTGVDINPDQIALAANSFQFPDNVINTDLIEGNAWDLETLDLEPGYSLIFSGMNLHHGTPEELAFLARQMAGFLADDGLIISHDVYRPDAEPYLPRPTVIDEDASALVSTKRLAEYGIDSDDSTIQHPAREPDWREDYLQRMHDTLVERGAETTGADSTVAHMRSRDFPVSTAQLKDIFEKAGFSVAVNSYADNDNEPLGPYVATCVITR